MRRPEPVDRDYHELCITYLETSPYALAGDSWLAKFFRAERLAEQIATEIGFLDPAAIHDLEDQSLRESTQRCQNHLLDWRVQVRQSSRTPLLVFLENLAIAYMHEPILYTPTNRKTFTAPYVADRLSISDFPAPVPSQQHITAVYELVSAVHAMIDIYATFDTMSLLAYSGMILSARAAYANYLLVRLYIATTAPKNTLSTIIDPSMLRVEEYCGMLAEAGVRVKAVDEVRA